MTDTDFSELTNLERSLGVLSESAFVNVVTAVKVTSIKTKKDWQEPLKGSRTLGGLPYAIDFDITTDGHAVTSEIGFNKDRGGQAALGNVSEYGTPTITGRGFGIAALEANGSDFEKGLDIALEQAERAAGL